MAVSVFELFTIGIGPSSSHTVGPMRAARLFATSVLALQVPVSRVMTELYGSLGHTGKGHGSDNAILLGLEGESPELVDTDSVTARKESICANNKINLHGRLTIPFEEAKDLVFHRRKTLPGHVNGMKFSAFLMRIKICCWKKYTTRLVAVL